MFSDSNSEAELGLESDGSFSQEEKSLDELLAEIHSEDCLHVGLPIFLARTIR